MPPSPPGLLGWRGAQRRAWVAWLLTRALGLPWCAPPSPHLGGLGGISVTVSWLPQPGVLHLPSGVAAAVPCGEVDRPPVCPLLRSLGAVGSLGSVSCPLRLSSRLPDPVGPENRPWPRRPPTPGPVGIFPGLQGLPSASAPDPQKLPWSPGNPGPGLCLQRLGACPGRRPGLDGGEGHQSHSSEPASCPR